MTLLGYALSYTTLLFLCENWVKAVPLREDGKTRFLAKTGGAVQALNAKCNRFFKNLDPAPSSREHLEVSKPRENLN